MLQLSVIRLQQRLRSVEIPKGSKDLTQIITFLTNSKCRSFPCLCCYREVPTYINLSQKKPLYLIILFLNMHKTQLARKQCCITQVMTELLERTDTSTAAKTRMTAYRPQEMKIFHKGSIITVLNSQLT